MTVRTVDEPGGVASWRLQVEHETRYEYPQLLDASYNEARITPPSNATQFVREHRVTVKPAAHVLRYVDYWGSAVSAFDVHEPHRTLNVLGISTVDTATKPVTASRREATWADVRNPVISDRFYEFLAPSARVGLDAEIRAAAEPFIGAATPAAALDAVTAWTHDSLDYDRSATSVTTTAAEVLRLGRGVCQDFVHLAVGLLRSIGIPARYVSGYLHPRVDAEVGEAVVGESHAWVEAWIGSWQGVDPTNGSIPGRRHVLVAQARDYADVAPLKGVYHGPPGHIADVRVAITRVA